MSTNTKTPKVTLIVTMIIAGALGAAAMSFFQGISAPHHHPTAIAQDIKPLYWVAPMDANYRRDKPGKSPMGMDLIPVYTQAISSDEVDRATVTIAPHVVNNLGVRTAVVELAKMDTEISTVGYVQYDEDQLIHIHPRVDGWIEQLYVKAAGNRVEKDQPLYTLYSPQLVNAQEELLIALKRNNRSLITAAKHRLKALQLSADFIQQLEQTRAIQQSITFYSPQSGVVDGLKVREGFYVRPGNTLFSIAKLDQVWVEAEVFERDAALITQGLSVSMTMDYLPKEVWVGVVDYVYPVLNSQTRTLRVRLKFANQDYQLKPNMFAQVSIHANQAEKTIVVPKESVIRTGKQDRIVLALGEGKFKSIEVTIGRVNSNQIEILTGLIEGDVVVTSAQFLIDSESSKSADFKRMSHDDVPNAIWMQGQVNRVMAIHGKVNITHGPAKAWHWSEMTMDFTVAEHLDIGALKPGQSLHFEVTKTAVGGYEITGIHIMGESTTSSQSTTPQNHEHEIKRGHEKKHEHEIKRGREKNHVHELKHQPEIKHEQQSTAEHSHH